MSYVTVAPVSSASRGSSSASLSAWLWALRCVWLGLGASGGTCCSWVPRRSLCRGLWSWPWGWASRCCPGCSDEDHRRRRRRSEVRASGFPGRSRLADRILAEVPDRPVRVRGAADHALDVVLFPNGTTWAGGG